MALNVTTAAGAVLKTNSIVSLLPPNNNLGGIDIQALLEEVHEDTLEVTEHPVEAGAQITDHSFLRPQQVALRCGWSNSSPQALIGAVSSLFSGGASVGADYVSNVYSQLRNLQQSRQVFNIVTGLRQYRNMLVSTLHVSRDRTTSQAIAVTAVCRQVILVRTQTTTLPPQALQKNPAVTAELANVGSVPAIPGVPALDGSVPKSFW